MRAALTKGLDTLVEAVKRLISRYRCGTAGGRLGGVSEEDEKAVASRVAVMIPSYHKLNDVVLCLLHEGARLGMTLTQYHIVKAAFVADRAHLRRLGRPITFDRYYAMKNGPVAITLFNLLKGDPTVTVNTGPAAWSERRRPDIDDGAFEYYGPRRPVDEEEILAPSEILELQRALRFLQPMSFFQIRDFTHNDQAYKRAFDPNAPKANEMDYAYFFEMPNAAKARELAYASQHFVD